MKLTPRRAMARMAWRDARRNRWRSLLVIAMIGLPILGLTAAGAIVATTTPTAEEQATGQMGNADLAIYHWDEAFTAEEVVAGLPDGTWSLRYAWEPHTIAGGALQHVSVEDVGLTDPVLAPIYELTSGTAPASATEIAVSPAVLERFGVDVGDSIELGADGGAYRIVGTVIKPEQLGRAVAVVAPGSLAANPDAYVVGIFVDFAAGTPQSTIYTAGDEVGVGARSLREGFSLDAGSSLTGVGLSFAVTALVLAETGLVAAAAFVVGTQRQLRTIGIVGATGGEPRHTRALVLSGGVLLGLAGSIIGVVAGLAVALAFSATQILDTATGRVNGPLTVPLLLPVGAIVLGTMAAVGAAYAPARAATRVATMSALAGRTPPPRPAGALARWGLVGVAAGVPLTAWGAIGHIDLWLFVGPAITITGFLVAIPLLVTLVGRMASRLPLAARIAARDTSRHGRRTGAAVAAATVALILPVAVATSTLSSDARRDATPTMAADQLVISIPQSDEAGDAETFERFVDRLHDEVLPGSVASPAPFALYSDEWDIPPDIDFIPVHAQGPPQLLREGDDVIEVTQAEIVSIGDRDLLFTLHAEAFADELEAGYAIAVIDGMVDDGVVHIENPSGTFETGPYSLDIAAVDASTGLFGSGQIPGLIISPARAAELGFDPLPANQVVVRAAAPIDDDQLSSAKALASDFPGFHVRGLADTKFGSGPLRAAILAFTAVVALGIIAVAVALISAESRRDRAILAAVGASPQTRRAVAGSRALLLTALAGILAVPAGFLPITVIQLASREGYPFVVPWVAITTVCLGLPLLAGVAATALSRRPPAAQMLRPLL